MISLLRWVAALPLGVLAAFAAHMILGFNFGIAHGFEEVGLFWDSPDMAGMPIRGTYIMLGTRAVSACALVSVAAWVAPQFKKQIGLSLAIIISILSIAFLIYLLYQSVRFELAWGFSVWYRSILELAGIIIGCVFGAGMSSSMASTNGPGVPEDHEKPA